MLNEPTAIETATALNAISLSNDGKELLTSAPEPVDFLHLLIEKQRFTDAMSVFPYIVPLRQAIWWACLCSWHGTNRQPLPFEDEAFATVLRWLQAPSERHYEAAVAIASKDVLSTPAEYCTRAVAWAGFMTSPEGPWQAMGPMAAAATVSGCAFLALSRAGKNGVRTNEKQLLKLGLQVADGALAWDDDSTKGATA